MNNIEDTWQEGLPPNSRQVLAIAQNKITGKRVVIRAHYLRKYEEEADFDGYYEPEVEYNEEKGTYYYLEGWYELIDYWDELYSVHVTDPVIAWLPIPSLPEITP